MHSEADSRHVMGDWFTSGLTADSEPKLALPGILGRSIARRGFLAAALATVGLAVVGNPFNAAEVEAAVLRVQNTLNLAQERFGKYKVVPKSYKKAGGAQSKLWLPARHSLSPYLASLDQADLVQYGSQWAYINQRGPHGDSIQALSDSEAKENKDFNLDWTGWCKAAAVAMGHGPILTEGATAFGVEASLDDLMIMDTLYHAYGMVVARWDDLTEHTYGEALKTQNDLAGEGKDTYLIGNTSIHRGYPNQQWWGLVMGIDPASRERFIVDFMEWNKFEKTRGQVWQNPLYIPEDHRVPIELIDPSEPEKGKESYFNYVLFHREVVEVFLDMADAIPK